MNKYLSFFLLIFISFTTACDKNDEGADINFDREEMLVNYSENLIVPAFSDYANKTSALLAAVSTFVDNTNEENFSSAKVALQEAYMSWAKVNTYQFGPGIENSFLRESNTFPTQFKELETDIEAGSWDLSSLYAFDNKGLPAVDYLLYYDSTSSALELLVNDVNRRNYLKDVSEELNALSQSTYQAWKSDGGNYGATFISNTGNDPSSGLSMLVNEFNKSYERSKNQRLGYPLGKNSLNQQSSPKSLEAYYSDQSLTYLKNNVQAIENIFMGGDGSGLDDYLNALFNAGIIKEDLTKKILDQIKLIKSDLELVSGSLADHVESQSAASSKLYDDMQDLVVMIKSEMPSALSVSITYTDNDGD